MKKSTIILILIVFVASVFVVGIFGVRSVPYNERIYITSITPTAVTLSNDTTAEIISRVGGYRVYVPYEENLVVLIDYEITPDNATNKTLEITVENINENSDAELLSNGGIMLKSPGVVKVTYRATDSPDGPSMVFYIFPTVQN